MTRLWNVAALILGLDLCCLVVWANDFLSTKLVESVERYEGLLDLGNETERLLSEALIEEFRSDLFSLMQSEQISRKERDTVLCRTLCRSVLGVFRTKMALTKELLYGDTLVSVSDDIVAARAPWIANLFKIVLEKTRDLGLSIYGNILNSCACGDAFSDSVSFLKHVFDLRVWKIAKRLGISSLLLPENCDSMIVNFTSLIGSEVFSTILAHQDLDTAMDLLRFVTRCYGPGKLVTSLINLSYTVAYVQCQSGLSCYMWNGLKNTFSEHDHFSKVNNFALNQLGCDVLSQSQCNVVVDSIHHCQSHTRVSGIQDLISNRFLDLSRMVAGSGWKQISQFEKHFNLLPSSECHLPQIHISKMTRDIFLNVFVKFSIPVVIKGVSPRWHKLWHMFKRGYLLDMFASVDFLGGKIPYGELFGDIHGYTTIEEFIQYMDTFERDFNISQTLQQFPMYIFDPVFLDNFKDDYTLPEKLLVWSNGKVVRQFILGPAGSGAPFHHHCPAFNTVFYGTKRWYLLPPARAFYSKLHPLAWFNKGSLTNQSIQCTQNPGDTLFVPQGWGHATLNVRETVAVAMEIDNGFC